MCFLYLSFGLHTCLPLFLQSTHALSLCLSFFLRSLLSLSLLSHATRSHAFVLSPDLSFLYFFSLLVRFNLSLLSSFSISPSLSLLSGSNSIWFGSLSFSLALFLSCLSSSLPYSLSLPLSPYSMGTHPSPCPSFWLGPEFLLDSKAVPPRGERTRVDTLVEGVSLSLSFLFSLSFFLL